jgi:hypothetical protein
VNGSELAAFVLAGISVLGAIGSVAALSFRVGSLVGTITAFMAASERDRGGLHDALTRQADRLSLHIEHHSAAGTG